MDEFKLRKLRYGLLTELTDEYLIEDIDFSNHWSFIKDTTMMRIKGFVWAEDERVKRQEVKYPRNWWQAFKERFFPGWVLKRWPVEYHNVVLDVMAIYPNFRPAIPDQECRLTIQRKDYRR